MKKKTLDKTLMSVLYGLFGILVGSLGWMVSLLLLLGLIGLPIELFTDVPFNEVSSIISLVSVLPGLILATMFVGFVKARKRFHFDLDPMNVGDHLSNQISPLEFWIGFAKIKEIPSEVINRFDDVDQYRKYVEENAHSLATVVKTKTYDAQFAQSTVPKIKWYLCYMSKSDELNLLLRS